jgi:CHAD domain-containing protein
MSDSAILPDPLPPEALEPSPPALVLELSLDPAAVPLLWKHPMLPRGNARSTGGVADECVWLDTAEGHLARLEQLLEAPRKGPRRLIRTLPRPGFSVPGALPDILDEYTGDTAPAAVGDEALLPIAAFTGRRAEADRGPLHLSLRHGKLRCVAAEASVARLTIAGPAADVLALTTALARDLPLLPANAGLAETARALARQERPRPRRVGPPDLGEVDTIEAALAQAIAHLTEVLLAQAPRIQPDLGPEGVHQCRVAARRLRSCLKQFRPVLDGAELRALDTLLADFARALGEARDLDVFLMQLGAKLEAAVGPADKRVGALLRTARQRREAAYVALVAMVEGPQFRHMIWAATRIAALRDWGADAAPDPEARLRPFAQLTLARRWRRLLKRGAHIKDLDAESLHELRLDAKRLRYPAELFAPLWPGKAGKRFLKRLSAVQEALGVANDTHVARALVAGLGGRGGAGPWAIGLAEGFALAHGTGARQQALAAWKSLDHTEPFWVE